jgi:hypothetical protein
MLPAPVTDWRSHLASHIEAHRDVPFAWGQHDCALWVSSCLEVTRGVDLASRYRGTYESALGALRQLRLIDAVASLDDLALKHVGPHKHVAFATAGDVVAADLSAMGLGELGQGGISLGICFGPVSYFVAEEGLVALRTLDLEHAYG